MNTTAPANDAGYLPNGLDNFECDDCGYLGHTSCGGEGWEGDPGDPDNIFGY